MTRTLYTLLFIVFQFYYAHSQILVDGRFDDWESIATDDEDNNNDAGASGIDFTDVKIKSDSDYLYLKFAVNREINLQDANKITVYIDTDNNPSTGVPKSGIGADIEFRFGDRYGLFYKNGSSAFFEHPSIGMISAPTVTSEVFEVLFRRDARINGNDVFSGNDIKIRLKDEISSGDAVPNGTGGLLHSFDNTASPNLASFSFTKPSNEHLRFMSYNVKRDDLFEPSKYAAYARIFKAVQPDIIGIQEVYDNSSLQVRNIISQMMGLSSNNLYYDGVNSDVHVVSRYPIEATSRVDGNAFFLINKNGQKILFCVAHLPCCSNDNGRQEEVDKIMSFIRRAKNGTASIDLPNESPIVIVGDMNLVGKKRQVETLLTGNIFYSQYGSDFAPDWDDTDFEDAIPPTTGMPSAITWNNIFSDFAPGRLDYLIYSGSVMELDNAFSLNTATLSQSELQDSQLQTNDTGTASDHLPIIGDFLLNNNSTSTNNLPVWAEQLSLENYDNGNLSLQLKLETRADIQIQVSNVLGQVLRFQSLNGTRLEVPIDLSQYNKGVYFISITIDKNTLTKKVIR